MSKTKTAAPAADATATTTTTPAADEFQGQGGTYVVENGVRRRLTYWETIGEPEPQTDATNSNDQAAQ